MSGSVSGRIISVARLAVGFDPIKRVLTRQGRFGAPDTPALPAPLRSRLSGSGVAVRIRDDARRKTGVKQ
jgi:hypothetical protein